MKEEWIILNKKNNLNEDKIYPPKKQIACVLGYFNGSKYILEQLQSIINQEIENVTLSIYISDDNSDEDFPSLERLNFKSSNGIYIFYRKLKKNIGYEKNFLYALKSIVPEYDFYCFSDQDDIWEINKIYKAINVLKDKKSASPNLYFSRTTYFNEDCSLELGKSHPYAKKPSFKNAIVQNIAGGNTIVFNQNAKNIICESIENIYFVSHDWWCYLIVSGAGGDMYYDLEPSIKYRQHENNFLGSNNSLKDRIKRIRNLFQNQYKNFNEINLNSLNKKKYLLTNENLLTLKKFSELRKKSIFRRIFLFYKSGIYSQKLTGNIELFIALIFKKL